MEPKFTEGDWNSQPCHEGIEIYKDDIAIARIPISMGGYKKETINANAALIKHAPNMFEALQNFLGLFDTPISRRKFGNSEFFNETVEYARNVIEDITKSKI